VATWDDVERIVSELPATAEATPRNWRVRTKLIAWERPLRKADYAALGADAPDGDILGARVAEIGVPELGELLTEAWLAQAPKTLAKAFLQNDS
jgi:hypothetical protein